MNADCAQSLFDRFRSFRESPTLGQTPHQLFTEYCKQVLGSAERLHFDFKQKRDSRDAILHDDEKKNLAKALSGFANSGGGVLILGRRG